MSTPTSLPEPGTAPRRAPGLGIHRAAVAVLLLGIVVVGAITVAAEIVYNSNEARLLKLRTHDASQLLVQVLPSIETPLASGVELAEATHNPRRFVSYIRPYISSRAGPSSAGLFGDVGGRIRLLAHAGAVAGLKLSEPTDLASLRRSRHTGELTVAEIHGRSGPALIYAYSPTGSPYIAVEQQSVDPRRPAKISSDSSFAGLNYAIYFGSRPTGSGLLATSVANPPLTGRTASVVVPFGSARLDLVMSSKGTLGGRVFEDLPWLIAIVGLLLTGGAAIMTERLVQRRIAAEHLAVDLDAVATENRRLYDEQRDIARTLQHSLLPSSLPEIPTVSIEARYLPGVAGIDVGGDWYDVVRTGEHRCLITVGDVSGRGITAATVMAELRYAIRAYAIQGDAPEQILEKLSRLHSPAGDTHFATVLCADLDIDARQLTVANAGHLSPVLVGSLGPALVSTPVGRPIGVPGPTRYSSTSMRLDRDGTILMFTDGLVERRDESIDASLARLVASVGTAGEPLATLLDRLLRELGPEGFHDDTAILGVAWET